jgi:hypothetical protein
VPPAGRWQYSNLTSPKFWLHSFLALGAHFAAIISGEHSPFSPDEIRSLIATVGASPSNTLMDKLAGAVAAVRDRERVPQPPPRHRRRAR